MNHLLLTNVEGKKVIVNVDFMMAVQVQYKKPQTNDKVRELKERLIDATNVIYNAENGLLVLETPEEIYEQMLELDYEYTDTEQEPDEKGEDPDEAEGMRALPPSSPRLEGCDVQAVQRLSD